MSSQDDSARDPVRPPAERWAAESPFVDEAAEERTPIHPWYQSHTPFVEGRELEEMYAPEAEWESDLAVLEAESPLQSASERSRTSLIEPGELEGLDRESVQETGEEEGEFERDVPPAPPPNKCGFHGPNGVFVTEADLRSAVAKVARDERKTWLDSTSQTLQKEKDGKRFGDLVRYWLAGLGGKIHPGKLEAVQQAALDPNITYGNLSDATLNAAIRTFGVAENDVNDSSDKVYEQSAIEDSARATFKSADARWKDADKAVKAAEARVKDARGQSGSAAQAELDKATMKRSAARLDRDTEKKNLDKATRARKDAKRRYDRARNARKPLEGPKGPASNWILADRQKIRKALLVKAAGTDPQNIEDIIDHALIYAHRSRADIEPWSAVFVVSCVRAVAIGRKLEAMDSGLRVGKDGLLKASRRHSDYVVEARERKRKAVGGTYHAFEPRDLVVKTGDIICIDRTAFIPKPVALKDLKSGRTLHCDIVTSIGVENEKSFAVTIGGNVGNTVRRRRYPLDSQGRLVVSAGQLFVQEKDHGEFPPFDKPKPVPTTMLAGASTGRIIALLSPIWECKNPGPTSKGTPTGKGESFPGHLLESLESPFLDQEILPTERRNEFDSSVERLADESPYVGALEERRSKFDEDQLEEEEAPIHPWHQSHTPFVESQELEEMYASEAEWEAHLTALEAKNPFGDASEQDQTTLSEPEELEVEFVEEDESAWERDEFPEGETEAYDEVAVDPERSIEELYDAEAFTANATSLEETWIEPPQEEGAYSLEEAAYADEELAPDEELFIEHEEEEVDWETSVSEQSPTIPAGVAEFAVTLGKEWAKRRNGSPTAEKITEWLLQDYQDTLEGARHRFRKYPGDDSIGRGWMISRQDQMKFQTSSSAGVKPLRNFQPPTDSVALVSNNVINGSDQAPVAPIVVRLVEELRRRYRGVSASTYPKHGGGKFDNRGYSIELWLKGLDDRGFYPPGEALKFLRALHEAAMATNAEWRVIYNDFSVAETINRETGQEHVIFVGKARQDKNKKITGLNWHGPHPLILHFHLDLVPGAGAPNARVSVPSATTTTST